MQPKQSLADLTAAVLAALNVKLEEIKPDLILIQGDTTTVFTSALAAYYQKIKIGHVEAGLRTGDKYHPFPEEANRVLTDQLSDLCFAPTEINRHNLLQCGIPTDRIYVTGNTIIDALQTILAHPFMESRLNSISFNGKMILVTAHRRESFGKPLRDIFEAIRQLAQMHPDILFVYPVHPNPQVKEPAYALLNNVPNVKLTAPLNYLEFVSCMQKAYLILTDSGGVQEEAPALHKPVLVLRHKTERPEVVMAGGAKLIGTNRMRIIAEVEDLMQNDEAYNRMANSINPYGDGTASNKIVNILQQAL
jgi:UDP-N-acetylglucosamine 2-epimerase (non-hydrolysing)